MDSSTAQAALNSIGIGAQAKATGYYDFPTRDTDRTGVIKSINSDSFTLTSGRDTYDLSYDKTITIRAYTAPKRGEQNPLLGNLPQ
ncbi:hypothetical protein [Pseudomonas graminis]